MYTIYTYWNADMVRSVLNAMAIIMNGADYLGLVKAIAIAGLLTAATTALVRMRGDEPLMYFIALGLVYGVLFVPKATVTVQDLRTNSVYTVDNVPLGVALLTSESSHIGKWLTDIYETHFTAIEDEMFSQTGMAFGARLVRELQLVKVRTPNLVQSMNAFVKDCVNPEFIDNPSTLDEIVRASDVWGYIGGSGAFALNPGRVTSFPGGTYACTGDGGAYAVLDAMLQTEANTAASDLGARLNAGNPLATTVILSQIPAIEGSMLAISRTAQDSLKQGMVMNMLLDSQVSIAQSQANPAAAQIALAVASAEQQAQVSYAAMARVAEGALPWLRNAVEILVIAIFPFIFVILVLAGIKAGLVLKTYAIAVFWVQLWAPLYAVINSMSNHTSRADFLGAMNGAGGNTISNMGNLATASLSNSSITGLLTISVPIIAYAMLKAGDVAMSGIASSVMGPAQQAAQRSGDAIGQGNLSAGNVSWGTVSTSNTSGGNWQGNNWAFGNAGANKQDYSSLSASGDRAQTVTPSGSYTQDLRTGAVTGMQGGGANWSLGATTGGGTTTARSNADSSSTGVRASQGHSASYDLAAMATSGNRDTAQFSRELSTALSTRLGQTNASGQRWETTATGSSETSRGGEQRFANTEAATFATSLGVGANVGAAAGSRAAPPSSGGAPSSAGAAQPASPAGVIDTSGDIAAAKAARASGQSGAPAAPASNAPAPATPTAAPAATGGTAAGGPKLGANLNAGAGLSNQDGQQLVDAAFNRSGSTDQKTQAHAANILMAAVNDVIKNTNDAGVRGAAKTFAAELQHSAGTSDHRTAAVSKDASADSTKQQGTTNHVGGSFASGGPVAQQLLNMAGGDPGKALELAQNPEALATATQAATAGQSSSPTGQAILGTGGVTAPESQPKIAAQGEAAVAGLAHSGAGHVAAQAKTNSAAVHAAQPAAPGSAPNTAPATTAHAATAAAATSAYGTGAHAVQFEKGVTDAAAALYASEQKGLGTIMSNSFLGAAGYKSPEEYSTALTKAAGNNQALADTLVHLGQSGGQVSPEQLDYLKSALKHQK